MKKKNRSKKSRASVSLKVDMQENFVLRCQDFFKNQSSKGRAETRVDNDNHFVSFFAKKGLQMIIVFREKMMRLSR